VSPYPEFFAGLGRLSSVTADAFAKTDSAQDIDARAVAQNLLDCIEAEARIAELFEKSKGGVMVPEELEEKSQKHRDYMMKVINSLPEEGGRKVALSNPYEEVRATAKRVSAGGEPTERDKTLLALFDSTSEVADMLRSFSKVCDTLAAIARKQLAGQAFTEADKEFFLKYGICLAEYHFYGGDSWVAPRDDFSMVTPVFVNPLAGEILYAGITRPQALYVIAPVDGKPVLHLGAVLSYREFHQPARKTLDDQAWIDRVSKGQAPPPPAFTASFMRESAMQQRRPSPASRTGRSSETSASTAHRKSEPNYWPRPGSGPRRCLQPCRTEENTVTMRGPRSCFRHTHRWRHRLNRWHYYANAHN
jgi:hypothetical protein